MLADKNAMATIAVKDLAAAKTFYQQKLGFSPIGTEGAGVVTFRSGNSTIVVYESCRWVKSQVFAGKKSWPRRGP